MSITVLEHYSNGSLNIGSRLFRLFPGEMMSMKSVTVAEGLSAVSASARPRLNRFTVIFSFLSIYLLWGSTYLAIRYAVETIPPLYTADRRHLVSVSSLLAWCLPSV